MLFLTLSLFQPYKVKITVQGYLNRESIFNVIFKVKNNLEKNPGNYGLREHNLRNNIGNNNEKTLLR